MKDKYFEDGARSFLDHVEDRIRGALSPENSKVLTAEDKRHLEWALDRLRPSFDELAKWFIDPVHETKPSVAMDGYKKLWDLLGAGFIGGSRGTVTDSGKNYFDNVKTQKMRDFRASARASSPEEMALHAAIDAERPAYQIERHWKEASAIHSAVNKRLESDGYKPVSIDKIRLRLQKFQRS